MDTLKLVLIGIVQGISEWLPISSKTQVLLTSHFLLGLDIAIAYTFGLFMELGSIGSALIYFRREVRNVFEDRRLLVYLVIVTLITGIIGVPLYIISDKILQNAYNPGIPMIILGIALIIDGIYIRFSRTMTRSFRDLSIKDYLIVGFAQGLAALPGVSRSGMTVSTMLFLGVKPEDAFKYSYLAYIPAALGAVATTVLFSRESIKYVVSNTGTEGIIVAVVAALLTGLIVIDILIRLAKKRNIYIVDFVLGAIAIAISLLVLL
ncbi:undecaprenyl-diphosphate phosphatase [Acidianus sp. RZ1]|uniref:undecaprenyl-diphosphate phosphatase n=1 Tax=Acidianus sp. RZ1 TaxID=1540082 RepID=UPI001491834E|nr:undecaprenyl-diphosphate phosphatase [Acidianus sp. RZ1]NON62071.1 undecaprenyl-diphosphate phosphatase [Acidianus sp. RZ1]